jgi:hypothetical protein
MQGFLTVCLMRLPALTSMHVELCPGIQDADAQIVSDLTHLKQLILDTSASNHPECCRACCMEAVRSLPLLEKVDFQHVPIC